MSELLEIQPKELKFIVEYKKQSSCLARLANITNYFVAFKVKTTAPKKYCVQPNMGIVLPNSTCELTVIKQLSKKVPLDLDCKDKFLIQSTVVSAATTVEDITASMFAKDGGGYVEEKNLRVILVNSTDSQTLSQIKGDLHQLKVDLPIGTCLGSGENNELLEVQPKELKFIIELKKQSSCLVRLPNVTDYYVAFKVKTTTPKKYCVRPNMGVVLPNSTCEFTVTRQAPQTAPLGLECNDKFLIQSTIVSAVTTVEDITSSMFAKEDGNYVEEKKLRVKLASPPHSSAPPSIIGDLNNRLAYQTTELIKTKLRMVTKDLEDPLLVNSKESKPVEDKLQPAEDVNSIFNNFCAVLSLKRGITPKAKVE